MSVLKYLALGWLGVAENSHCFYFRTLSCDHCYLSLCQRSSDAIASFFAFREDLKPLNCVRLFLALTKFDLECWIDAVAVILTLWSWCISVFLICLFRLLLVKALQYRLIKSFRYMCLLTPKIARTRRFDYQYLNRVQ